MGTEVRSELLGGRYRLLQRIGSGGMAGVHLARDERLGRDVAVKLTYRTFGGATPSAVRIEQEARRVAQLNHPNVVQVHDVGMTGEDAYIVMELVHGRGLDQVIRDDGPMPERQAIDMAGQVCSGLTAAHSAGIVHRDIKPSNLLVDETGRARIADFGTARTHNGDTVTEQQAFCSAPYVSPEQATGAQVDHRSDLYSLGVVLYEMLTGRQPFEGDTLAATVLQRLHHDPPPPSHWVEVSPRLDAVVMQALSRNPQDRFADADAMATALRSAATPVETTDDRQRTAPLPVTRPRRRLRHAWLVLAAITALLGALWVMASGAVMSPPATDVLVPDVSGMTIEAASRVLTDHDLEVGVVSREPADDAIPGTVLAQTPSPETPIEPGGSVDLVVADRSSAPASQRTAAPPELAEPTSPTPLRGEAADVPPPATESDAFHRADPSEQSDAEDGGAPQPPGRGGTPPGQGGEPPGKSRP